ncbi:hypothetical protein [Paracoccus laeviglucosivorans]|uniref:hypothetical protein n=1 Tax=Paracoccus laeviglucosivorans TaxID=1197861 RepID=UPI001157115D|nr:hypothetical protein [Paracoccus laeviglucosivorans]
MKDYKNIGRRSILCLNPLRCDIAFSPAYIIFGGVVLFVLKRLFTEDDEVAFASARMGDATINGWGDYNALSGESIEAMFWEKVNLDQSFFHIVKRIQIALGDGSPWKEGVVVNGRDKRISSLMDAKRNLLRVSAISSAHLNSRWSSNFFFFDRFAYFSSDLVLTRPELEAVSPVCSVTWS